MPLHRVGFAGVVVGLTAALFVSYAQCADPPVGGSGSSIFDPGVGWSGPATPAIPARPVTDQEIQAAIDKGVAYLWTQQNQTGYWDTSLNWRTKHPLATTSMACYALLECGIKPKDERLTKALDWLEKAVEDPLYRPGGDSTYTLGLRTQAWLLANRSSGGKYARIMKRDIERLVASTPSGGYDYVCTGKAEYEDHHRPDNSNSQFALYGVWAGKLNNQDISEAYWKKVLGYWMGGQKADGGWSYEPKDAGSRITMAEAGLASLYVCFDSLYGPHFVPVGAQPPEVVRGMDRALAYIDFNFPSSLQDPARYGVNDYLMYYHLFGIQRAGLATGHKRFGGMDWYEAGTRILIPMQKTDGRWSIGGRVDGNPTDEVWTSYALMFLARGQRPLPFVHLNWGDSWNNRPHSLPNLYLWMGQTLERKFRLEVVSVDDPVQDWGDSKILLITGHTDPKMSDKQLQRLRSFVAQGGVIFSITEGTGENFSTGIRQSYHKLFPWNPLKAMSASHPIQNIHSKLGSQVPFSVVMDGDRVLAVHTDADLTKDWQENQPQKNPLAFDAGTNVYLFAERQAKTGKAPSPWSLVQADQLKKWSADEPLVKATEDYETQLAQLEKDRQESRKVVGSDLGESIGKLAKAAAQAGKVNEAMALIDARKAMERGEVVDLRKIDFPGVKELLERQNSSKSNLTAADEEKRVAELETKHEKALADAQSEVLKRLKVLLADPSAKLDGAQTQELTRVIKAVESNSPALLWDEPQSSQKTVVPAPTSRPSSFPIGPNTSNRTIPPMMRVGPVVALPPGAKEYMPLLSTMSDSTGKLQDDTAVSGLVTRDRITTRDRFGPPARYKIVLQSDLGNFSLTVGSTMIGVEKVGDKNEMRIMYGSYGRPIGGAGPFVSSRKTQAAGNLPMNEWVTIEVEVTAKSVLMLVNGEKRVEAEADMSTTAGTVSVYSSGATLKIKSVGVKNPE